MKEMNKMQKRKKKTVKKEKGKVQKRKKPGRAFFNQNKFLHTALLCYSET